MNSYTIAWKKVDSLISKKGLTRSALDEVRKIYAKAKKEKQDAQLIKALLYQYDLEGQLEEDADQSGIKAVENEIATASEPARSILHSLVAQKYWQYLQSNRWELYDRTQTIQFNKEDLDTWTLQDFHKTIAKHYLGSISNKPILESTKPETFEPIIIKGNVRFLRPTLYDLLAHKALEYFENDERDITKPAYAFVINDEKAFAAAEEFMRYRFETKDSTSLHFKAFLIYQELIEMHFGDKNANALIDVDLKRLQFVYRQGIMEQKDDLYKSALERIINRYPRDSAAAEASYLLAQYYFETGSRHDPSKGKTSDRDVWKTSKAICESTIQKFPQSEAASNCHRLLNSLLRKELLLHSERVNLPDIPFRTLVSYRNFSKIYYRIFPIDETFFEDLRDRWNDSYWKKLVNQKPLRSFEQELPAIDDHRTHSVEIKIDALSLGRYALLASTNPDFGFEQTPLAVQYFHVSNISFINHNNDYFVLHRETGKPLGSATVQLWQYEYDYARSRQKLNRKNLLTADLNGYFTLPESKDNNRNVRFEIGWKADKLFLDEQYYPIHRTEDATAISRDEYEEDNRKTFLFTDRSIYRPGQTLYFKGIVITKDFETRSHKILPGFKTTVALYDANNEIVDSLELTTGEFGSYSGKFNLPAGLLNGEFSIEDQETEGTAEFNVEEYKRPRFYVEYGEMKGSFRLNDTVTITGSAKSYSGNVIDGAGVKYRVVREARFPYPWLFWKWGFPRTSSMEITNGEVITGSAGEFVIRFRAIPDNSINKEFAPTFEYKVITDVTDINGETRSAETAVSVGYKALDMQISFPRQDIVHVDSLKHISVVTKNLSGVFEPTLVNLSIYPLQAPDRLIRPRYWNEPDTFLMSKEEYLKYFPLDEYKDESRKETWKRLNKVLELKDTAKPNSQFPIPNSALKPGWYIVEANAKDRYGEDVSAIQYIRLYDPEKMTQDSPDYFWALNTMQTAEPGQSMSVELGSSAEDLWVIGKVDKRTGETGKPVEPDNSKNSGKRKPSDDPKFASGLQQFSYPYTFFRLSKETKRLSFPVNENDRGGFGVLHAFVKHNRFFSSVHTVYVPWNNKELNISYTTYRDKTQPGSKEQWKIKISGSKGEKLAAEVLAGMYDASLDQFKPHSWIKPGIYETYFGRNTWQGKTSFGDVQSQEKWYQEIQKEPRIKQYDAFIWQHGFDLCNMGPRKRMAIQSEAAAPPDVAADTVAKELQGAIKGVAKKTEFAVDNSAVQIRKNFNESAFFIPDLKTDSQGNVEFSFTMPEALTQWKWQTFAHTKDLAFGLGTQTIITQKELMVQPNPPRFLREGDQLDFSAKISNITQKEIAGQAQLELVDALTMQPVDGWFKNIFPVQYFTAAANQSTVVNFRMDVPHNYNKPLLYRIIAKSGNLSDGEENMIPVLTNRMLVTESLPILMKGTGTKNFSFEKLSDNKSESLTNHNLTVEYSGNPAWYAIQSLPYLMEYPYDCAEQVFNRYYANALASTIANSSPKIKAIFEKWKTDDTAALLSNLQKNEELKTVLLQETPWVLQAKSESQQKKNVALLFDLVRMSQELNSALEKLKQLQSPNGGFVWFQGGPDDRFITQYILTGIGRLKKLKALPAAHKLKIESIVKPALEYLHKRTKEDYDELVRTKVKPEQNNLGYIHIQYIYLLGFFREDIPGQYIQHITYYHNQAKKYWLGQNRYMQGMIALALYRSGDSQTARAILASLRENAINSEAMGMYWKDNRRSFYWHQAPIETQALLIEAFSEIVKDDQSVNNMKIWLLNQKRTQNWETTKATADACYALLVPGVDLLSTGPNVEIKLGNISFSPDAGQTTAGTGYFKKTIEGKDVKPEMGNISVTVVSQANNKSTTQPINQSTSQLSWGAVYWQYFENLDQITPATTPLSLTKRLFKEKNSPTGPVLMPVNDGDELKVGEKIKVRIELRSDRDMEYIHMKDMRASGSEPVNVLSSYKWQGALGYYETTKDASTNFFFSWIPKGTYVFEYATFVTHTGNFSVGVATIQCMYAPEFTSHSEGIRINVTEK